MVNFSLEGKVALVTGASYGIGFAIATAFAKAGATIVFNDIKQELVDKGLAAYEAEGIKAHGYVCDVTNEEQVNAFVAKTPAARWGTPEDLMGPAVFLASDASNFVNGHVLYVDGGILAYIGKQP